MGQQLSSNVTIDVKSKRFLKRSSRHTYGRVVYIKAAARVVPRGVRNAWH